jgi:hypothetical protein
MYPKKNLPHNINLPAALYIGIIRKYEREDTSCSPNYSMETPSGAPQRIFLCKDGRGCQNVSCERGGITVVSGSCFQLEKKFIIKL